MPEERSLAIFYHPEIAEGSLTLGEEESKHCIKVLRQKVGDRIRVFDGTGGIYTCTITEAHAKHCQFRIDDTAAHPKPTYHHHIAIAPTKNMDRLEWFVEKAVEIGIQEISLLLCDNSERKVIKTDRLLRKAVGAMKQSQNPWLPIIHELTPLKSFVKQLPEPTEKYIAYVDMDNPLTLSSTAQPSTCACVLIGPEGDFSHEELDTALQVGFTKVSLGKSRLRTETAGIVACHTLMLANEA